MRGEVSKDADLRRSVRATGTEVVLILHKLLSIIYANNFMILGGISRGLLQSNIDKQLILLIIIFIAFRIVSAP